MTAYRAIIQFTDGSSLALVVAALESSHVQVAVAQEVDERDVLRGGPCACGSGATLTGAGLLTVRQWKQEVPRHRRGR